MTLVNFGWCTHPFTDDLLTETSSLFSSFLAHYNFVNINSPNPPHHHPVLPLLSSSSSSPSSFHSHSLKAEEMRTAAVEGLRGAGPRDWLPAGALNQPTERGNQATSERGQRERTALKQACHSLVPIVEKDVARLPCAQPGMENWISSTGEARCGCLNTRGAGCAPGNGF